MRCTLQRRIALVVVVGAGVWGSGTFATAEPRDPREQRAPIPLDGIAAVVGSARIFRSDVETRARSFLDRLSKDPVKRRGELVDLHKQVLVRMIDETLIRADAAKLHIEVTDAEVAEGVARVMEANKVDKRTFDAEIARLGLTRTDYDDEVRRQILEGKWIMLRAASKIDRKLANEPASYQAALEKQRELLLVDLRSRTYIEVR